MAKLSAHGREVARIEKFTERPENELTVWTRVTYAIMSDGYLMKKLTVRFAFDEFRGEHTHSYGWKRCRKLLPTESVESFVDAMIKNHGFEKVIIRRI